MFKLFIISYLHQLHTLYSRFQTRIHYLTKRKNATQDISFSINYKIFRIKILVHFSTILWTIRRWVVIFRGWMERKQTEKCGALRARLYNEFREFRNTSLITLITFHFNMRRRLHTFQFSLFSFHFFLLSLPDNVRYAHTHTNKYK